eukprot:51751-Hanusia_phi.AAC.4
MLALPNGFFCSTAVGLYSRSYVCPPLLTSSAYPGIMLESPFFVRLCPFCAASPPGPVMLSQRPGGLVGPRVA